MIAGKSRRSGKVSPAGHRHDRGSAEQGQDRDHEKQPCSLSRRRLRAPLTSIVISGSSLPTVRIPKPQREYRQRKRQVCVGAVMDGRYGGSLPS